MLGEKVSDLEYWRVDGGCSVRYWHGYGRMDGGGRVREYVTSSAHQ